MVVVITMCQNVCIQLNVSSFKSSLAEWVAYHKILAGKQSVLSKYNCLQGLIKVSHIINSQQESETKNGLIWLPPPFTKLACEIGLFPKLKILKGHLLSIPKCIQGISES